MEYRYIILQHYESTEQNDRFPAGTEMNFFSGKSGRAMNSPYDNLKADDYGKLPFWQVKEEGYKTKASAAKGLKAAKEFAKFEESFGFWKTTTSLIEIRVG